MAGGPLLHRQVQVDRIAGAVGAGGLQVDFVEVAKTVHALLGAANLSGLVARPFELAELPADHPVPGAVVALDPDSADIDPPAGIHPEGKVHGVLVLVDPGHWGDVGESVAFVAHPAADGAHSGLDLAPGEQVPFLQLDQGPQLVLRHHRPAGEVQRGQPILGPFRDVDRDEDMLAIRGELNLGGIDLEMEVAPV